MGGGLEGCISGRKKSTSMEMEVWKREEYVLICRAHEEKSGQEISRKTAEARGHGAEGFVLSPVRQ